MSLQFLSVRDLRSRGAEIWRSLAAEREMVVTSNGRPVAILSAVDEASVEDTLRAIRQARAVTAVTAMQESALKAGLDRLTDEEIEDEIRAARQDRRAAEPRR
jgi:antitoxin (DNA-binding transcriptional repressor) of toxin-antitoxin stability system